MPSPETREAFLEAVRKAQLITEPRLRACLQRGDGATPANTPRELADLLMREGTLTRYQATLLLKGSWDSFRIGPYRILERLGFGAMSNVYLCKHRATQARVAVKVLAATQAKDPVALKRFYREARATASLDHPNIVRVHDVDWDGETNFIVMDFVDGSSIQDIIKHFGAMDIQRAAHYIRQAALGLQHACEHGLVHRDIKPGNLLIDRKGEVKILDMGLARFAEEGDMEVLTQGEVLGSPEYLAPEQALDSHKVDIRADIYALGSTFYLMLTGKPPYHEEKSVAGKLLSKETRPPKPIRSLRPEVPENLVAIVDKMMAKAPAQRYQNPLEVAEALTPWGDGPISEPPEQEMPQLSPAAQADPTTLEKGPTSKQRPSTGKPTPPPTTPLHDKPDIPPILAGNSQPPRWFVQGLVLCLLSVATFVAAWIWLGRR